MSKALKIEIKGLKSLEGALRSAPKETLNEMSLTLAKTIKVIEAEAKKEAPADRGTLRSKIVSKSSGLKGAVEARTDYAVYVHEGTRPHFPPISAVEGWARRHGIEPFLVARAISRKGTKAHPFFEIAFDKAKHRINSLFNKLGKNLEAKILK